MTERNVSLEGGVRGTLAEAAPRGPAPCVVFLHGFGGHRNEVGGLFAKLAPRLAERGLASLRIDFPGCGTSDGDFAETTIGLYAEAALAALRFAGAAPYDAARVGLLGFSFGGAVATVCVQHRAAIRALALWAPVGNPRVDMIESIGAARAAEAERSGDTELPWGDRKIRLKHAFFASLAEASPVAAMAGYDGALFVVAGSRDRLVKHVAPIHNAATRARRREQRVIAGADHFFNALDPKSSLAEPLLAETVAFFESTLLS